MYEFKDVIRIVEGFFQLPQTRHIFDSMAAEIAPSKFFVDDKNNPSLSLAWDRGSCFFFGGKLKKATEAKGIIEFLKTEILKEETRKDLGVAKLYYPSDTWEEALREYLKEFNPQVLKRVLYGHDLKVIPEILEANLHVLEIDRVLMESSSLGNLHSVTQEINRMWGSVDNFLKNGFGICVLDGNDIICWCTAEYVSEGFCGIGIETIEGNQNKGIATVTTIAFLKKCARLGIRPYWDSWKNNIPSVRVAEKTGFKKVVDYKISLLDFFRSEKYSIL